MNHKAYSLSQSLTFRYFLAWWVGYLLPDYVWSYRFWLSHLGMWGYLFSQIHPALCLTGPLW